MVEIYVKRSKSFLIGCFTAPPGSSKYLAKNYNDQLQEHLNAIVKENKKQLSWVILISITTTHETIQSLKV